MAAQCAIARFASSEQAPAAALLGRERIFDGGDALPTLSETSLLSARAAVQAVVEAELALSAAQVRV